MPGRIAGRYTTDRDGGISYTYVASWHEAANGVVWSATVKRDQALVGAPGGQLRHVAGVKLADEVRRLVELAIEKRAGIDDPRGA